MSAFSLSFSALLRVGEITASNSVDARETNKQKTNKKRFKCRILVLKTTILICSYGIRKQTKLADLEFVKLRPSLDSHKFVH